MWHHMYAEIIDACYSETGARDNAIVQSMVAN